jgi:hypothetical protein
MVGRDGFEPPQFETGALQALGLTDAQPTQKQKAPAVRPGLEKENSSRAAYMGDS